MLYKDVNQVDLSWFDLCNLQFMSNSNSEHLEYLKLARDKVTTAIVEGKDFVNVTLGQKSGSFSARHSVLEALEEQIIRYKKIVSYESSRGTTRTKIRLGRRRNR